MVRSNKKLLIVGAMVLAAFLVAAPQASAFGGWGCGWGGCYPTASYYTPGYAAYGWWSPCYTSCYSPCYSSCYSSYCGTSCGSAYLGCRSGPVRRRLFGSYRWYYANGCNYNSCGTTSCYGGCGTTSCYDGCGTSCCGPTATTLTPDTTVIEQPMVAPAQQPATDTPAGPVPAGADALPSYDAPSATGGIDMDATMLPTRQNSGLLTVWVPAKSKVFINGKETSTQGSRRRYVSYGLQPGLTYKFEVRAELVRDGMIAEETKTVYLNAGASEGVAFGFNRQPTNQVASTQ